MCEGVCVCAKRSDRCACEDVCARIINECVCARVRSKVLVHHHHSRLVAREATLAVEAGLRVGEVEVLAAVASLGCECAHVCKFVSIYVCECAILCLCKCV